MDRYERECCEHFMRAIHCKQEMFEVFQIGFNVAMIWIELLENGPMNVSDIAKAMMDDEDRVRECLYYGVAALIIADDGDGEYGAVEGMDTCK